MVEIIEDKKTDIKYRQNEENNAKNDKEDEKNREVANEEKDGILGKHAKEKEKKRGNYGEKQKYGKGGENEIVRAANELLVSEVFDTIHDVVTAMNIFGEIDYKVDK